MVRLTLVLRKSPVNNVLIVNFTQNESILHGKVERLLHQLEIGYHNFQTDRFHHALSNINVSDKYKNMIKLSRNGSIVNHIDATPKLLLSAVQELDQILNYSQCTNIKEYKRLLINFLYNEKPLSLIAFAALSIHHGMWDNSVYLSSFTLLRGMLSLRSIKILILTELIYRKCESIYFE